MSYRHLFLVSTANANWQKMCHLGSPAHKNCVTLRAGMVASATRKQIFFNQVSILAHFFSNITAVRADWGRRLITKRDWPVSVKLWTGNMNIEIKLLKLIHNSLRENKGNHNCDGGLDTRS